MATIPKIGLFIDSLDEGGAECTVLALAEHIPSFGCTTEILHFGNPYIEKAADKNNIAHCIIPAHDKFKSAITLPLFAIKFRKFLKQRSIDLLNSHLLGAVFGGSLACFPFGIPHVGTLHDCYSLEEKPSRFRVLRCTQMMGTSLVTVSDQMRKWIERRGRFREETIRTIHNGINLNAYRNDAAPGLRAELGIDPEAIVIISVGRLVSVKNHQLLIAAFNKLKNDQRLHLLIVGDGELREELQAQCHDLEIESRVQFLGHREDVPDLLSISNVFTLTSNSEGLPFSILDAMASGLPVIASDVGGNSELVANRQTGFLFEAGDIEAFSKHLSLLTSDPSLRIRFGVSGQMKVEEQFTQEVMLKQYVLFYQELLNGS